MAKPNADFNNAVQLQKAGEDIFRRAIEEQIELCRFFGRRWEQYLNLPSDVSRCRSVLDLAQVQSTFLTKMLLTMASRAGGFCKPTKSYLQIG